ncbi:hypothetical protein GCM10023306_03460 [Novosphingobium ginsenosidimutans]
MVGELQVIFGLHAVAVHVGVLGELAILFEQLRRIAPGPAVDPVELLTATTTALTIATAAPTIVVTTVIVVQGFQFPASAAVGPRDP